MTRPGPGCKDVRHARRLGLPSRNSLPPSRPQKSLLSLRVPSQPLFLDSLLIPQWKVHALLPSCPPSSVRPHALGHPLAPWESRFPELGLGTAAYTEEGGQGLSDCRERGLAVVPCLQHRPGGSSNLWLCSPPPQAVFLIHAVLLGSLFVLPARGVLPRPHLDVKLIKPE